MPVEITDPDGKVHSFPDGTTAAAVNAEMDRRWAARNAPPAASAGTPLAGQGKMPPGATPAPMTAKASAPDADMVPLSEDAQRAQRLMTWGAITNNRSMEQAGKALWEQDPTAEARKKQATIMGELAAKRGEARIAGEGILRSYAQLKHEFDNTPDSILSAAIGPYAMAPYSSHTPMVGGMTPPQAAAAYGMVPQSWASLIPFGGHANADDAWNAQNTFYHLSHGITNAFVANAGKGLNMTDARQQMFDKTMRDFMEATDRKAAQNILTHAKAVITNDFHLTPERADEVIAEEIEKIKAAKKAKQAGAAESGGGDKANASGPPIQAVQELLANADQVHIESFNRHFNGGKPGLAEFILKRNGAAAASLPDAGGAGRFAAPGAPLTMPSPGPNPQNFHNLLRRAFGYDPV